MAFGFYSPVTIDHTKVPSTQTDFPVLISLTDNRFRTVGNGGHVQNSNGYDIRPYSDSALTSSLTYELERYNASTGEVIMWVKISSLSSSSDTVIYLAYGNSSISTDGSSTSTWSNGFISVYHLKDGTTLDVNSATNSHNGTNHSATATTGQIDGAAAFVAASSQYVDLGTGLGSGATAFTASAWAKITSLPGSGFICVVAEDGSTNWNLEVGSAGKLLVTINCSGGTATYSSGSHTLSTATWYFLAFTYSSTNGLIGYVNASSDGTVAQHGSALIGSGACAIGRQGSSNFRYWDGSIDELRMASVERSANWITTEYNNQSSPSTFETLGTEVATTTLFTLDQGSYVLTGESVGLDKSNALSVAQGSYSLIAQHVTLLHGYSVPLVRGNYTVTGSSVAISINPFPVDAGYYTLTGSSVSLLRSSRTMSLDYGNYVLTGFAIGPQASYKLAFDHGSYIYTGESVSLIGSKGVLLRTGHYVLTTERVLFYRGRRIILPEADYILTGENATLLANRYIVQPVGLYSYTGYPIGLAPIHHYQTNLLTGLYIIIGEPIGFSGPFEYLIDLRLPRNIPTMSNLINLNSGSNLEYVDS